MSLPQFDRHRIQTHPLSERVNRVHIECDAISCTASPGEIPSRIQRRLAELTMRIERARAQGRPVICAFGAHAIKNGLAPVFIDLMERGWVTHLATNGAGVIHDWEFAYLGESSEHVAENLKQGKFGTWEETGRYINLAIAVGAYEGHGYGEAVGAFIESGLLDIPSADALRTEIKRSCETDPARAGAAADLLDLIETRDLQAGHVRLPHPFKRFSVQAAAHRLGLPFTSHPMFGHDIIYTHPLSHGASIGRAAERDFLAYAQAVSELDGGVYLSIGSAVMSPMVFEKSMSMAQNLAAQDGRGPITDHYIFVTDLAEGDWDWSAGEPPEDHPAYYQRFNKTFSRVGGTMRYAQIDNRDLLLVLSQTLPPRIEAS